jgi:ferritin-like metal-binding protein YciE
MEDKNFLSTKTQKKRFEMVESTLTAIGRITKKAVIGAIKGSGEKAQAIMETTADDVFVPRGLSLCKPVVSWFARCP